MMPGGLKVISAVALAVAVFVMAPAANRATALDARVEAASQDRRLVDLQITDGRVTGAFEGLPLADVLDALAERAGFAYDADVEGLEVSVSRRFEAVPLGEVLSDLLRPFNYTMAFSAEGEVRQIRIDGLRDGTGAASAGRPAPRTAEAAPPEGEAEPPREIVLPRGTTLTEAQRRLFGESDMESGVPDHLYELFYPEQPPGSEETGPPEPATAVLDPPDFGVVETNAEPPGSDLSEMELPEPVALDEDMGSMEDPLDLPSASR